MSPLFFNQIYGKVYTTKASAESFDNLRPRQHKKLCPGAKKTPF